MTKEKEDIDIEWGTTEDYWKKDIEEAVTDYVSKTFNRNENKTITKEKGVKKWILQITTTLIQKLVQKLIA